MRKLDAKNLSEKPTNMKYYEGGSMRFITSMKTTRLDVLHESTKNENIHEKNVQVTSKRAACKKKTKKN